MLDIARTSSTSTSVHTLTGSSRPGVVPPLVSLGAAAAPLGTRRAGAPSRGQVGPNSVLLALVEEFEAKHAEATALSTAAGDTDCDEVPGWRALADRLNEISAAMYEIRAENMDDVLLVSRFLQIPWVRDDKGMAADLGYNLADDVLRISKGARVETATASAHQGQDEWRRRLVPLIRREDRISRAWNRTPPGQLDQPRAVFLRKLSSRLARRVLRWTQRLLTEPATDARSAGLKADVYIELVKAGWTGGTEDVGEKLALTVARDALRLIEAEADANERDHEARDGELLALGRAWKECAARHDRAVEDRMAAEDRVIPAAVPEVLFLDPERDPPVIGAYSRIDYGTGRRWYGEASSITGLRKPWHHAFCLARRDEILAAYDTRMAGQQAAAEAAGVPAATDAAALLATENLAIRRRILALPAQTLDGLMLKMSVARWCLGDIGTMEVDLEGFIRSGDANEEAFALSVVLDASRVLGTDVGRSAALAGGVQPVPLDFIEFPAGRYLAGVPREEVETYRTFLDLELKYLNHEVYGRHDGKMHYWHDNPAARFLPSRSPASTRAAAVLGLLGLMPIPGVDGRAQAAASAA